MDLMRSSYKTPPSSLIFFTSQHHSSHNSFPIIVVAIIGILATAFLLLGYYIFVIKCCLNWHRIDLLRRFSLSRNRRHEHPFIGYTPDIESRGGLDESVIRSIPIFQFKKAEKEDHPEKGNFLNECAVCLSEFHEEEKLRVIPNCGHVFHIDCIDVWLQNNANCPICRTSISMTIQFPILNQVINISPSSSPSSHQDHGQYNDNIICRDQDYVVIELGEENDDDHSLLRVQERFNFGELPVKSPSPPPKNLEQKNLKKSAKKFAHVSSMGDECIDIRGKDERLSVQPFKRSFSMDSADDRQLYLAVQEIVKQNRNGNDIVSSSEGCSSRIRRSLFSLGNGRGSRRAVLPIHGEK